MGQNDWGVMTMRLSRLLAAAGLSCEQDAEVTYITCDSREVGPGALFAALEGARTDGRAYIAQSIAKGAAAVICKGGGEGDVPIIDTRDPRRTLALLAAEFYGNPARDLTVVAVTGRRGKPQRPPCCGRFFSRQDIKRV